MNGKWILPLGIVLLLLSFAPVRKPVPADGRPPKQAPVARGAPEGEVDAQPPPAAEEGPWPAFLKSVADVSRSRELLEPAEYRRAMQETAARFLQFDEPTMRAFESTRRTVQAELESMQREISRIFDAYPADLPDAELQRIQSDAERRFQEERQLALARFEAFLSAGENHRLFREYLETWTMDVCRSSESE